MLCPVCRKAKVFVDELEALQLFVDARLRGDYSLPWDFPVDISPGEMRAVNGAFRDAMVPLARQPFTRITPLMFNHTATIDQIDITESWTVEFSHYGDSDKKSAAARFVMSELMNDRQYSPMWAYIRKYDSPHEEIFMGTHARAGAQSSVKRFVDNLWYERQLWPLILSLVGRPAQPPGNFKSLA